MHETRHEGAYGGPGLTVPNGFVSGVDVRMTWTHGVGTLLCACLAVDSLAEEVGVPVVPSVFLDHVGEDPAQAESVAGRLMYPESVERFAGLGGLTGSGICVVPQPQ